MYLSYEIDNKENKVAMKTFDITKYTTNEKERLISLEREVAIIKKCYHPLIVNYLDSYSDEAGKVYIILEYANLGSL